MNTRAWQVCGVAMKSGLAAALIVVAGCSGGDPMPSATPTSPTPAAPAAPPPPAPFSVQMAVTNGQCLATRVEPVSCNFEARPSGGQGPYSYAWTFSTEDATVTMNGATVKPVLGCRFSGSSPTFDVYITLNANQAGGSSSTYSDKHQITRVPGDC